MSLLHIRPARATAVSAVRFSPDPAFMDQVREGYSRDAFWQDMQDSDASAFECLDGLWYCKAGMRPGAGPVTRSAAAASPAARGTRLCIPDYGDLRASLLAEHHDTPLAGHLGVMKTVASLQQSFYWPAMTDDVKRYVASCDACQRNKPSNQAPAGLFQPLPIPQRRWQQVSMDLITQLPSSEGHDAILVVVDMLSKMVHCVPTHTTATAEDIAVLFFREVVRLHGLPEILVSDRDSRFTGHFWTALMGALGTKLHMSTPDHPQTDGQTERANRTVETMLRAYVNAELTNWRRYLPAVEFAINSAVQSSTGFSPFYLNYGEDPMTPVRLLAARGDNVPAVSEFLTRLDAALGQARQNISKAQQQQAAQANRHRRSQRFEIGDSVLLGTEHLRRHEAAGYKLRGRFAGPFSISKVIGDNAYKLDLPPSFRIHPVQNVSRLRPYADPTLDFPTRPPAPPTPLSAFASPSEATWQPERLLAKQHRTEGTGRRQRRVLEGTAGRLGAARQPRGGHARPVGQRLRLAQPLGRREHAALVPRQLHAAAYIVRAARPAPSHTGAAVASCDAGPQPAQHLRCHPGLDGASPADARPRPAQRAPGVRPLSGDRQVRTRAHSATARGHSVYGRLHVLPQPHTQQRSLH